MESTDGVGEAAPMPTVAHLIERFDRACQVAVRLGQTAETTRTFYSFQLKKLNAVGSLRANELRVDHLLQIEFTNHFCRALKRLYSWASDEELIPKNQFKKLKTPATGQRTRILTGEETARLLAVCSSPFCEFLTIALQIATRPGELRKLQWGSVQLAERQILLTKFKSKDQRKDGVKVRRIPLTLQAVQVLAEIARGNPQRTGQDDFVFIGRNGKPWSANALRCRMRTARKLAGLEGGGEHVVCYTMRHTRATDLTRKGVKDNTLAEILGHTTTQMTRRYQHLTGTDINNIIDRADG